MSGVRAGEFVRRAGRVINLQPETPSLVDAVRHIRKNIDKLNAVQFVGERAARFYFSFAIVYAGYHRTPHYDAPFRRVKMTDIIKNRL